MASQRINQYAHWHSSRRLSHEIIAAASRRIDLRTQSCLCVWREHALGQHTEATRARARKLELTIAGKTLLARETGAAGLMLAQAVLIPLPSHRWQNHVPP